MEPTSFICKKKIPSFNYLTLCWSSRNRFRTFCDIFTEGNPFHPYQRSQETLASNPIFCRFRIDTRI